METWHNRIQQALDARGYDWPDLVRATGLAKPSVYAWKPGATKRTKMIEGENAAAVCSFLRIRSDWLFSGRLPSGLEDVLPLADMTNVVKLAYSSQNDDIDIYQFATGGAMGATGVVLRDQPGVIRSWRVSTDWLNKNVKAHSGANNLVIVTGFGDSMRPMFNPGDPLLVDSGVRSVDFDAIYFFRVGDEGFIKRLQRIPGEGLRAISANKEYESWTIKPDMDFEVFGRVLKVWCSEEF